MYVFVKYTYISVCLRQFIALRTAIGPYLSSACLELDALILLVLESKPDRSNPDGITGDSSQIRLQCPVVAGSSLLGNRSKNAG